MDVLETNGRATWMNFPDSDTISKEEYKHKIHWGMLYYLTDKPLGVTIIFSGKDACNSFLGFHQDFHEKIYNELVKLPTNFFIKDGNSFWDNSSMPPLDKEWNDPIPCNELSFELYNEILENLRNLIDLQKKRVKVGPVLDLAKTFCKET